MQRKVALDVGPESVSWPGGRGFPGGALRWDEVSEISMHRPHRALGVLFLLWGMILAVGGTWFASLLFSGTDHELPWFLALSAGLFVSGAGMGTVIASRGRTVRFVTSSPLSG
ncbi:MAG: hypothetical protein AAFU79_36455 [Myxococcota bacterium]